MKTLAILIRNNSIVSIREAMNKEQAIEQL